MTGRKMMAAALLGLSLAAAPAPAQSPAEERAMAAEAAYQERLERAKAEYERALQSGEDPRAAYERYARQVDAAWAERREQQAEATEERRRR